MPFSDDVLQLHAMAKKTDKSKHPGRKGLRESLYPLTADQAVRGMFQIAPADIKRIVASRPGRNKG